MIVTRCLLIALWTAISLPAAEARGSGWAIHEWGTFTSLQDEAGQSIAGINTDDEPVPQFVHRLSHWVLLTPSEVPVIFFQGAPKCHPHVTMRLETPVIYFHPPEGAKGVGIQECDVKVQFRGGWLTEFYPMASPEVDGLQARKFKFGPLSSESTSSLEWPDLKVGGDWPLTNTTEHVWTSPRAVEAALVRTPEGEAEKFLFYRGVAHIDAPLRISREKTELVFRSQLGELPDRQKVNSAWLVNIRADGKAAFRALPKMQLVEDESQVLARTAANFAPKDFSASNLETLKHALRKTLIAEGLFADEAEALLNTWELSYFKSAGLRLFFIVPPAWTDHYLPLEISVPDKEKAKVNRVMVGRIELVQPEQRRLLKEIAGFSPKLVEQEAEKVGKRYYEMLIGARSPEVHRSFGAVGRGEKPLASMIDVPKTYRTYLDLGRFRNALILEEAKRNPSAGLTNFINTYRLDAGMEAAELQAQ